MDTRTLSRPGSIAYLKSSGAEISWRARPIFAAGASGQDRGFTRQRCFMGSDNNVVYKQISRHVLFQLSKTVVQHLILGGIKFAQILKTH